MATPPMNTLWDFMSGHELEVVGEVPGRVICSLCKKLMIKPFSASCGCHFCGHCIRQYLQDGNILCAGNSNSCGDVILEIGENVIENSEIQNEIGKVFVKCQHTHCDRVLAVELMEEHMRVCTIVCPFSSIGCNEANLISGTVTTHLSSEMVCHYRLLIDAINNLRNDCDNIAQVVHQKEAVIETQRLQIEQLLLDKGETELLLNHLKETADSNKLLLKELHDKERLNSAKIMNHGRKVDELQAIVEINEIEKEKMKANNQDNALRIDEVYELCVKTEQKCCMEIGKNGSMMEEYRALDLLEIEHLRKSAETFALSIEEHKKELVDKNEKLKMEQDRCKLENERRIKIQTLEIEDYKKKNEVDKSEIKKTLSSIELRIDEIRRQSVTSEEKRKQENGINEREKELLAKYKKEIRIEFDSQKVKIDDLQKTSKRNKTEIEKCKSEIDKCKSKNAIVERDSDLTSVIAVYKLEQGRQMQEIMELKQSEKNTKTSIEKQKKLLEDLKKSEENIKLTLNNLAHRFHSNEALPHIFRNQSMQEMMALKQDLVELSVFRDLKKQVLKNVKDIDVVSNTVKKFNEDMKTISGRTTDPDLIFDYVWTIMDFSEKKKESEFMSDIFRRGHYNLRLHMRLDGYNLLLSLCVIDTNTTDRPEWSQDFEFVLGIISQYTLRPYLSERISCNTSRNKSVKKKCDRDISLCIGGPCFPIAKLVGTPGLLMNDSVVFYLSLPCNLV